MLYDTALLMTGLYTDQNTINNSEHGRRVMYTIMVYTRGGVELDNVSSFSIL